MQQQEHVSEEAAKMAKMTGGEGPDIEGQGTPVQDILKNDKEAREQAPQVMQEEMKTKEGQARSAQNAKPNTSARSFSTMARRKLPEMDPQSTAGESFDAAMIPSAEQRAEYTAQHVDQPVAPGSIQETRQGHKYPLPDLPIPANMHKDYRHDAIVTQVTNLIMRDGKKAQAERIVAVVLSTLRTSPAPTYDPARSLLPGAPPASHLPLHPVLYLTLALDSVAPLLRIRSQRGAAGGGVALQIPVPLGLKQRRRQAFMWILDAAQKRKSRGSGKDMFALKLADEIMAVVEGKSTVWEKRGGVHRLATTARSNLNYATRGRRGF